MPIRTDPILHGLFTIKAMASEGGWKARAFRRSKIASPTFEAVDRSIAINAARAYLDDEAKKRRSARGPDGYPTAAEVREAFEHLTISVGQQAMLDAHLSATNYTLTATQLAQAAGYASYEAANSQYGALARALAEQLQWTPSEQGADGHPIWTFALAIDAPLDETTTADMVGRVEWRWKLRPQLVEALAAGEWERLPA